MRTPEDIQAELRVAKVRLVELQRRREHGEQRLRAIDAEIRDLEGLWRTPGTISRLERELESSKAIQAALLLPRIRLIEQWGDKAQEYGLVKITPKRIYVRNLNEYCDEFFVSRDNPSKWGYRIHPDDLKRIESGELRAPEGK